MPDDPSLIPGNPCGRRELTPKFTLTPQVPEWEMGGTQVHAHMHIYMHKEGERKIKIMEK